jgi:hypothetical protein
MPAADGKIENLSDLQELIDEIAAMAGIDKKEIYECAGQRPAGDVPPLETYNDLGQLLNDLLVDFIGMGISTPG